MADTQRDWLLKFFYCLILKSDWFKNVNFNPIFLQKKNIAVGAQLYRVVRLNVKLRKRKHVWTW